MQSTAKAEIRSRYWRGESLQALAQSHQLPLWHVEMWAGFEGWTVARAMLDELRSQLAASQGEP